MDKWMSKILAEKGPSPNIDPKPLEHPKTRAEPHLAPSVVVKGKELSPRNEHFDVKIPGETTGLQPRQHVQHQQNVLPAQSFQQSPRQVAPSHVEQREQQAWQPRSLSREVPIPGTSPDLLPQALPEAQVDGLGPTVTQLPSRGHKVLPKVLSSASDSLGPTVTQLPSRCPQSCSQRPVMERPEVRQLNEACYGSMRAPISEATRAVEARNPRLVAAQAGSCRAPLSDMTRAVVERPPRQESFVASSSDGAVIFNLPNSCRAQGVPGAPGVKRPGSGPASGAVSPTGSGGLPFACAQRQASFAGPVQRVVQSPTAAQMSAAPPRPAASHMPQMNRAVPHSRPQGQAFLQPQGASGLEVSQRVSRANELQRQLQASPPAAPYIGAPSLLDWAKAAEHGQFSDGADAMGLGLNTLHQLPPPPRSAPAVEAVPDPRNHSSCRNGGSGHGQQHVLTVLTSDSRWETLNFSRGNLEQQAKSFLTSKGLKEAFCSGLVAKMKSMVASGQAQSSVDIVDLI